MGQNQRRAVQSITLYASRNVDEITAYILTLDYFNLSEDSYLA